MPPPDLTRGWWVGLLAGLCVIAGGVAFNVLVDPTGEFGQSGRHAFNREPPPDVIAKGVKGGNPAFFTRAIREHQGQIFLIGSSRTWRGFDTCSRPEVLRVAGSGWRMRTLARVERAILDHRRTPAILLIEVGLPTEEPPPVVGPMQAAVSAALSPGTLVSAARTAGHSLKGGGFRPPTYASCAAHSSPAVDWIQAERSLRYSLGQLDTSSASLARGRQDVVDVADWADRVCGRTGLRHQLVLFTLPAAPEGAQATAHERVFQQNAARLEAGFAARTAPKGGCEIRYVNFSSVPPGSPRDQRLWRDRSEWTDYVHFSPRLGAIALDALLGVLSVKR